MINTNWGHSLRLCALLFLVTACASSEKEASTAISKVDSVQYKDVIKKYTRHDTQYEGFYNKFEVHATFINSEVQSALVQKMSDSLQWDTQQTQKERENFFQESTTQTKFALSFYVPSVRLNDLHKGTSIWKVYLVSGGERYEGKVSRRNGKLENIQALYPYHNRWMVAYDVSFNIPLSGAESAPVTLVLSSTQGTAKLQY